MGGGASSNKKAEPSVLFPTTYAGMCTCAVGKKADKEYYAFLNHSNLNLYATEQKFRDGKKPAMVVHLQRVAKVQPDCISLTCKKKKEYTLRFKNEKDCERWNAMLFRGVANSIEDIYSMGKVIGSGGFAEVKLASDRLSEELVAVKIMKLRDVSGMVKGEIDILREVSHPGIVNLYDVQQYNPHIFLVMEYIPGGELFDCIVQQGRYSEKVAAGILKKFLEGLNYLHERGIVHRDIKPENLLVGKDVYDVKIADFGLASHVNRINQKDRVGTTSYIAPEVLRHGVKYGLPVDMWAAGVILYILLAGYQPFDGRTDHDINEATKAGRYSFRSRPWKQVSNDAKGLIKSLLQIDPEKRLTASQVLQHPWILGNAPDEELEGTMDEIVKFNARRKFKKGVQAIIGTNLLWKGVAMAKEDNNDQGSMMNVAKAVEVSTPDEAPPAEQPDPEDVEHHGLNE
eukprot:GFYU01008010.1.p1 GENE.GFYU01008010.1~~GFYU01008010.1.p1  ORF type:complete len:457 (+),score=114.99 GFYU01008010.1:383-1753(+)